MTLTEKLKKIQESMKAPKAAWNEFGGYRYRSCETIFEALKPFEEKYGVMLTITDDIVLIGDRYYIKATARLYDAESDTAPIEVSAWAREPAQKKGMDDPQITGAASTYARKCAMNGLFLLDDAKGSCLNEVHDSGVREDEKITADMAGSLKKAIAEVGVTEEKLISTFGRKSIMDFTIAQYNSAMKKVEATRKATLKESA